MKSKLTLYLLGAFIFVYNNYGMENILWKSVVTNIHNIFYCVQHSCRFGTTWTINDLWGWVNYDIFWQIIQFCKIISYYIINVIKLNYKWVLNNSKGNLNHNVCTIYKSRERISKSCTWFSLQFFSLHVMWVGLRRLVHFQNKERWKMFW